MQLACTFEYLHDANVLGMTDDAVVPGPVIGVIITDNAVPAKAKLMTWTPDPDNPDNPNLGHPDQFDLMENVTIDEQPDGSYEITGDSMRAEGAFGVGNSVITLKVVPR